MRFVLLFGIPTVLVGIASLIMAIGFYTSVKYKHDGHDFLTKDRLCYKVLSMKMSIVYGIDPETKLYGALGHEILEKNTGQIIDINNGTIFASKVTGVIPSSNGNPGEKQAIFYNKEVKGNVLENTNKR